MVRPAEPRETVETILFLHGLTGCGSLWEPVAAHLSDRFRTLAPDLRGHGSAPRAPTYRLADFAADVIALLEQEGPSHLVGHSLGAAIAWTVAAERPGLVRRLALEDQHPDRRPDSWHGWQEWAAAWPREFASRAEGIEFLRLAGRTASWWIPSLVERAGGTWGWAFDFDGVVSAARELGQVDSWATLARVKAPTLLIRGAESPHLKPETAAQMVRTIPDCRLITLPGADHWVHEQPEPYAAILRDFLSAGTGDGTP